MSRIYIKYENDKQKNRKVLICFSVESCTNSERERERKKMWKKERKNWVREKERKKIESNEIIEQFTRTNGMLKKMHKFLK